MNRQAPYRSLADLANLLPESEREISPPAEIPAVHQHDGKGKTVRIRLDTKGRKGKTVTIVSGLQHNPETMEMIARKLKQFCGAGGTIRDREIEIQGDQREKMTVLLRDMNYVVR
jgi:translation initiation factor 1